MSDQAFEGWAVVELFGHQKIAGKVTEVSIAGGAFLRVDVPEQLARTDDNPYGFRNSPPIPEYTRYFGAAAIYALNPCSESIARRAAAMFRATPPIPFDTPELAQPRLGFIDADE